MPFQQKRHIDNGYSGLFFFNKERHPKEMGAKEIESFLSPLASHGKVAVSTQKQDLNALVFLYRDVLFEPLDQNIAPIRAKCKCKVKPPTVLACEEVEDLFTQMKVLTC